MTNTGVLSTERLRAALMVISVAVGLLLTAVLGVLIGYGWLYVLRDMGWASIGPRIGDALPLLQLATADRQHLLAVICAWLLAGALAGLIAVRLAPGRRALLTGVIVLVLLLIASQASDAVTRNLRFNDVLLNRGPGLGPWLEALLFTIGCALPRRSVFGRSARRGRGSFGAGPGALGHLGLSRGELGHAAEHDGDGNHVGDHRDGVRAQ
jgi:hypothetical protein